MTEKKNDTDEVLHTCPNCLYDGDCKTQEEDQGNTLDCPYFIGGKCTHPNMALGTRGTTITYRRDC